MKILIVGEYSGFAKNLAIGLRELGHQVIVFASLDGWKKIDPGSDSVLYPVVHNIKIGRFEIKRTWIFRGIINFFHFKRDVRKYKSYFDAALIINYEFLRLRWDFIRALFSWEDLSKVMKDKSKVYLSACGDDILYLKYLHHFRYYSQDDVTTRIFFSRRLKKIFHQTIPMIAGVIPVMYEYAASYRYFAHQYNLKVFPTIPLPIHLLPNSFSNEFRGKIVIFHGLSRKCKGGEFIIPALEKIQNDFPNRVEVIMKGGIPQEEYLSILAKSNIVVDQCCGYSYGMNALYSMAMGKIVLSGNEPECEQEFGCKVPIINIKPEVNDIYEKLSWLISLSKEELELKAKEMYSFCHKFHDAKVVAEHYVNLLK